MREDGTWPYLMGEQQRPKCVNCGKDELWSHFCQFKSHGPACPKYDQEALFETLTSRCCPKPWMLALLRASPGYTSSDPEL